MRTLHLPGRDPIQVSDRVSDALGAMAYVASMSSKAARLGIISTEQYGILMIQLGAEFGMRDPEFAREMLSIFDRVEEDPEVAREARVGMVEAILRPMPHDANN